MPTEPQPVTLAQLVHRAAEDADWPVSGILESIEQRMAEAAGTLDPQEDSPGLQVAAAVTVYLAHRRDELDENPDHVLRMAARAEFEGKPPANVAQWLETAGIDY